MIVDVVARLKDHRPYHQIAIPKTFLAFTREIRTFV